KEFHLGVSRLAEDGLHSKGVKSSLTGQLDRQLLVGLLDLSHCLPPSVRTLPCTRAIPSTWDRTWPRLPAGRCRWQHPRLHQSSPWDRYSSPVLSTVCMCAAQRFRVSVEKALSSHRRSKKVQAASSDSNRAGIVCQKCLWANQRRA